MLLALEKPQTRSVCETTVAKYMIRLRGPPSQAWKTFLENHLRETIALDFFTVPTATFKVLFVLVALSHDRRRILQMNVTEHPTLSGLHANCSSPAELKISLGIWFEIVTRFSGMLFNDR